MISITNFLTSPAFTLKVYRFMNMEMYNSDE